MSKSSDYNNHGVFYTDGGCNHNDRSAGSGVHGYVYEETVDKAVLADGWVVTNLGYYAKGNIKHIEDNELSTVKPIKYVDVIHPAGINSTNNRAEMLALLKALSLVEELELKSLRLFTDSDYSCKGLNEWMEKWKANGFIKSTGGDVINKDLWVLLDDRLTELRGKCEITIKWIKAHNGHLGNDRADLLATIGIAYSHDNVLDDKVTISDTSGYWSPKTDRHPYMCHKRVYFNSSKEHIEPAHYYLADNANEDLLIGKQKPEASYSVIRLKEPDTFIDNIIETQIDTTRGINSIFMIKLEAIFNKSFYKAFMNYGKYALNSFRQTFNLMFVNRSPVTIELNPTLLSLRAIDNFTLLDDLLDDYVSSSASSWKKGTLQLNTFDITDTFYELRTVKKKEVTKLKSIFNNDVKSVKVQIDRLGKKHNIPLVLGLDTPSRNSLKKLEDCNTKLTLITWSEVDTAFKYDVIVESDLGIGIWSNFFANRVLVK